MKSTFYLSVEITEGLESAWVELRRMASPKERKAISKSSIVEAALAAVLQDLKANRKKSQLASKLVHQ
jgi:hypothetical protein